MNSETIKRNKPHSDFRSGAIAAIALVFAVTALNAQAAFVFTLQQVGSNVVATGAGTINIAALTLENLDSPGDSSNINPAIGFLAAGPTSEVPIQEYAGISGPASFGTGGHTSSTTGSGNLVAVYGDDSMLFVPNGYVSTTVLSDTTTWTGATFSSLGITPGTYTYTWGSASTADSLTVQAVPEPSTWAMMAAGVGGLLAFRRRRRS